MILKYIYIYFFKSQSSSVDMQNLFAASKKENVFRQTLTVIFQN